VVRPVLGQLLAASGGSGGPSLLVFFEHNVAALLLAALLAPATVGLSGFALTFLPGCLLGYAAALSSWQLVLAGVLPHGLIEIPVAIIAGGLLIQLGAATIHLEQQGGWARRLVESAADYVRALAWLVPALLVAAFLETRF
jgi:stage II sporulation protein M